MRRLRLCGSLSSISHTIIWIKNGAALCAWMRGPKVPVVLVHRKKVSSLALYLTCFVPFAGWLMEARELALCHNNYILHLQAYKWDLQRIKWIGLLCWSSLDSLISPFLGTEYLSQFVWNKSHLFSLTVFCWWCSLFIKDIFLYYGILMPVSLFSFYLFMFEIIILKLTSKKGDMGWIKVVHIPNWNI